MFEITYLEKIITAALEQFGVQSQIVLDKPKDLSFGDYSSNVAMINFNKVKDRFASPQLFAKELANFIKQADDKQLIVAVDVAGAGFINFKIKDTNLWQNLLTQLSENGIELVNLGKGRKAIVEYSSPNIAKPFTIGHLRSTIIGSAIANLLEKSGYVVFRDNHLGDWGTQFGKQIVAIKRWGDEAILDSSANPVKELVDLYVKFHQEAEADPQLEDEARAWFTRLEQGDVEARRLWQKCIDWSFKEFAIIYQRLGVSFSENNGRGFGESYFEDKMAEVIDELKAKDLAKEGEEGALLIFYPNEEMTPLMVQKKDGSTLYATRDLAADKWRKNNPRYQNADGSAPIVINEVGAEQAFYFKQLYRAEELLGWYGKKQRIHVKHGLYRFKEGKMSTRKGNVIWLSEVLDKAKAKALEINQDEQIAQAVSMAGLKWNDLKRKPEVNINFDWQEMLQLQGNSGPYLLYTYVRSASVIKKAKIDLSEIKAKFNQEATISEEEKMLLQLLGDFSTSVQRATEELSPNILCNYLYDLSQAFNTFYNKQIIITAAESERYNRLALTHQVATIIKQGLNLLGIETLEEM